MIRNIKHTWQLKHPVERVWQYLTNADLLALWLMPNDIKPVVGHKFNFHTRPMPGFDGTVYCEVLEVVPLQCFSYSWKGGPKPGKIKLDSVVIWTLSPTNTGSQLILEHNNFDGLKNLLAYTAMNMGWNSKIKARFEELLDTADATA